MRLDRRSLAHYESGPMSQSALKKIAALRRCGGLLSRLAYERGRKEGVDVEVLLRQAHLTPHEIKNEDIPLGVQNQIKFVDLVANATSDPLLGFRLAYSYDLREIGLLYYVLASAETLFGSLLRVARYSAVANDGFDLKVNKGNLLRVRLHYSGVARHSDVHQIEFCLDGIACAYLPKVDWHQFQTNRSPYYARQERAGSGDGEIAWLCRQNRCKC
jgi:Arabinose-binding domain of AraC transcription regulator, N-term